MLYQKLKDWKASLCKKAQQASDSASRSQAGIGRPIGTPQQMSTPTPCAHPESATSCIGRQITFHPPANEKDNSNPLDIHIGALRWYVVGCSERYSQKPKMKSKATNKRDKCKNPKQNCCQKKNGDSSSLCRCDGCEDCVSFRKCAASRFHRCPCRRSKEPGGRAGGDIGRVVIRDARCTPDMAGLSPMADESDGFCGFVFRDGWSVLVGSLEYTMIFDMKWKYSMREKGLSEVENLGRQTVFTATEVEIHGDHTHAAIVLNSYLSRRRDSIAALQLEKSTWRDLVVGGKACRHMSCTSTRKELESSWCRRSTIGRYAEALAGPTRVAFCTGVATFFNVGPRSRLVSRWAPEMLSCTLMSVAFERC